MEPLVLLEEQAAGLPARIRYLRLAVRVHLRRAYLLLPLHRRQEVVHLNGCLRLDQRLLQAWHPSTMILSLCLWPLAW